METEGSAVPGDMAALRMMLQTDTEGERGDGHKKGGERSRCRLIKESLRLGEKDLIKREGKEVVWKRSIWRKKKRKWP